MELKIEKMVYGGDGIARLPADERGPGKTAFLPFSIDGEEVEATIVEHKPGFARARIDRVLKPSPDRITPGCPYFANCGGCHYQHMSYERQLRAKSAILVETLRRTAKIELPCELQAHSSGAWNYRNRTRLKVQTMPEFALGYYKFRSHELLPIEECPISSLLINRVIAELWSAGRNGCCSGVQEIELFADAEDEHLLIELYCERGTKRGAAQNAADALLRNIPSAVGVVAFEAAAATASVEPRRITQAGHGAIEYHTKSATFAVGAGAFFQVNRYLIDELVKIVTHGASGKVALELYAGVGLFSATLAQSFAQAIAVEASQTSCLDLRQNAPREVKAVLATTEQYLEQASGIRPDFIVVDPPRSGLGERVVRGLAKLDAPRITYVSCDPSTLARDLKTLLTLGYRIDESHLIDLFPQTFHIESVFHLSR
jgi:23S rRNA (uracil1939-C5)-methyltransferase